MSLINSLMLWRVKTYKADNFIIDGEIYPVRSDGSPDEHKKMGTRVHSKTWEKASTVEVKWVAFDCLKWEGTSMLNAILRERWNKLYTGFGGDIATYQIGGDPMAFTTEPSRKALKALWSKTFKAFTILQSVIGLSISKPCRLRCSHRWC